MKILGVGFNYRKHCDESRDLLGCDVDVSSEPLIFHKGDSILRPRMPFFLPDWSEQIDYEAEIAVRISRVGRYIAPRFAHRYYDQVTIGLDMTARDLQRRAIALGQPWTSSKAFDNSVILGEWIDVKTLAYPEQPIALRLECAGQTLQQAMSTDMIHSIDEIIAYVSRQHTLKIGDIILTGTPEGVGPCCIGQRFTGYLNDHHLLTLDIK